MAKTQTDSGNPDSNEKHEPEKPKKTSKGMSVPVIIGIVCGIITFQAIIIILVVKFFIAPAAPSSAADHSPEKPKIETPEKVTKSDEEMESSKLTDEDKEKLISWEIKNIPATPRGMDKSAFFTVKFFCIPNEKKVFEKLNKKFDEDVTGKMIVAETEFKINDVFSKYSKEQLDVFNRDSLNILLYKQLKTTFDKEDIRLRKILVTWAFY
jgi:hypothetical protein